MRRRRTVYGWRIGSSGDYCLSRNPPDIAQVSGDQYSTMREAETMAELRKCVVVWCGSAAVEKQCQAASDSFTLGLSA